MEATMEAARAFVERGLAQDERERDSVLTDDDKRRLAEMRSRPRSRRPDEWARARRRGQREERHAKKLAHFVTVNAFKHLRSVQHGFTKGLLKVARASRGTLPLYTDILALARRIEEHAGRVEQAAAEWRAAFEREEGVPFDEIPHAKVMKYARKKR